MTSQILALLGALLLLAAFRTVAARRLDAFISSFAQQSLVLAAVAVVVGVATGTPDLYVVALLTLAVKAWAVPAILRRIAADLPADEVRSAVGVPLSTIIAIGLVVLAFFASPSVAVAGTLLNQPPLSISVSLVLMGLFVVSTRRHAVAQLVGLLTIENGLFSGAIAIAYGLPLIVEFGILFDILVAVVVVG
ncbi:MAG TPA: hypothetical protein VNF73_12340, partial [Candidatus Saccharimonadales bacterium]|nr:hypothetical protein [Candidatus Saccharimonadales bacterium]